MIHYSLSEANAVLGALLGDFGVVGPDFAAGVDIEQGQSEGVGRLAYIAGLTFELGDLSRQGEVFLEDIAA